MAICTGMFVNFSSGFPKSEEYLRRLHNHVRCSLGYKRVSMRVGRQADEDFALMVHADVFIGSGGGFDGLIRATRPAAAARRRAIEKNAVSDLITTAKVQTVNGVSSQRLSVA